MNVYIYMKRGYDDFCDFGRRKNKANSKPIQSQFKANLLAFSVLRSADSVKMRKRNLKKENQSRPLAGNPKHEVRNPKGVVKQFEKTKPICVRANWRKVLYERNLWQ